MLKQDSLLKTAMLTVIFPQTFKGISLFFWHQMCLLCLLISFLPFAMDIHDAFHFHGQPKISLHQFESLLWGLGK